MPSKSKAEQIAMAIAEHEPGKLYARNKGMLKMTHQELHDFASGSMKGKPQRVKKPKPIGEMNHFGRRAASAKFR